MERELQNSNRILSGHAVERDLVCDTPCNSFTLSINNYPEWHLAGTGNRASRRHRICFQETWDLLYSIASSANINRRWTPLFSSVKPSTKKGYRGMAQAFVKRWSSLHCGHLSSSQNTVYLVPYPFLAVAGMSPYLLLCLKSIHKSHVVPETLPPEGLHWAALHPPLTWRVCGPETGLQHSQPLKAQIMSFPGISISFRVLVSWVSNFCGIHGMRRYGIVF